jgi:hypothetical protein
MRRILIMATAISLACAEPVPIPREVAAHIEGMKQSCRQLGGTPIAPKDTFLISADLKGDGLTDWAIDEGSFNCDGAWSIFSGSGGAQVYVFAGISRNKARQSFMHGADGMRLERESMRGRQILWLTVGGKLCGRSDPPTSTEAIRCERSLVWNKTTKQFEFAPLSTIKIYSKP